MQFLNLLFLNFVTYTGNKIWLVQLLVPRPARPALTLFVKSCSLEIWIFLSLAFEFLFFSTQSIRQTCAVGERLQVYFHFLKIHVQKGLKAGNFKLFMTLRAGLGGLRNCTTWTLLPVVWTLSATSQLHKICYLSIFLCTVYMCANNLKLLQATGPVELGARGPKWGKGPCPKLYGYNQWYS